MEKSYSDILQDLERKPDRKLNDEILIIDGTNTFIRSFVMLQSINSNGHHTGGLVGFLRSLGYLVRTFDPTRVICVFDGQGSTIHRKNINPEYKAQRNIKRITNWNLFDNKEDEHASMTMQMGRLVEYLECLPVQVISIQKTEADDVISYLAQNFSKAEKKVTIVSSDKDFLQIVNKHIEVYSPIKKKIYKVKDVKEELGVFPENYLILKALLGDNSDNLSGIKSLGEKTILREFPEIAEKPPLELSSIKNICEEMLQTKKIFSKILYDWKKVEVNYDLMNLKTPKINEDQIERVVEVLKRPVKNLNTHSFLKMLEVDKIEGINKNTESWLQVFYPLATYQK